MRRTKPPPPIPRKQIGALLDENLYLALKVQAAREDRPVARLLEDAMRRYLKEAGKPFRR